MLILSYYRLESPGIKLESWRDFFIGNEKKKKKKKKNTLHLRPPKAFPMIGVNASSLRFLIIVHHLVEMLVNRLLFTTDQVRNQRLSSFKETFLAIDSWNNLRFSYIGCGVQELSQRNNSFIRRIGTVGIFL